MQWLRETISTFSTSSIISTCAKFTDADLAVLEEVSKEEVLKKIDVNNLPAIVDKLELLEIDLNDFITNPGIFFEFLDDPVKSLILLELNEILPTFTPPEVETFLLLQQAFEKAEKKIGDPTESDIQVLSKMLNLLMTALPTLPAF